MRFSSTSFSQTKIHLFVLENTVDLLCKPYRWILSLCTVQRIALAQGSTFPVTKKKKFTAPIILYPCVAAENTISATVNEIMARGSKRWQGKKSDGPPPPQTHTYTLQRATKKKKKMQNASGEQSNGNDKQNVSLRYLFNIPFSQKVRGDLKPWESSSGWVMAPLVAVSSEDAE